MAKPNKKEATRKAFMRLIGDSRAKLEAVRWERAIDESECLRDLNGRELAEFVLDGHPSMPRDPYSLFDELWDAFEGEQRGQPKELLAWTKDAVAKALPQEAA